MRTGSLSSVASAGTTSRRTWVSLGPLIFSTTSSMRQPTTSSIGPLVPWPTPTMRSPGLKRLLSAAGPPAMTSRITTTSSCFCSCAPIPSSDSDMFWLNRRAARGLK